MNERVKRFLDNAVAKERELYEKEKNKTLIEMGLADKVYSDTWSAEFMYTEYDSSTSRTRFCKVVPIEVTDEEYEEIKKHVPHKNKPVEVLGSRNVVSKLLTIIAIVIYVVGFIAGFILGVDRYDDLTFMVIVWWVVFFAAGTMWLGFAEIIDLLDQIKKNLR